MSRQINDRSYVLVTAAYNEEDHIEATIKSVVAQTLRPKKWVIVNDASSDRTEEIVRQYAAQYNFIELCNVTEDHPRNLTAQVHAINRGFALMKSGDYDFIGNLDSDVSFAPTYFETLVQKFEQNPRLGLGGGFIYEEERGEFRNRRSNSETSVAHAVQLFRRECLQKLGGYKPFSWAGADWHAEVSVRMMGWEVRSFPDLPVSHHRPTGKGFGLLRYWYMGGVMDFYMGVHPLFEVLRLVRRSRCRPLLIGAFVRLFGFVGAYCQHAHREVSPEFIGFLRREQMQRVQACFSWHMGKSAESRGEAQAGAQ